MALSPTHLQHQVPIATLEPSIPADSSSIAGVVALIWPYSSATGAFCFLLVEQDFRLRREKGQVLVRLYGSSAKGIARSGIINGDQILLSLTGATWIKDDCALRTPGKSIDWELQFRERVVIQISHPAQDPIYLDIDHPKVSPKPEVQSRSSPRSALSSSFVGSTFRLHQNREPQSWSSPAFLKNSHLPYATYFNTEFDPLQDDERFADNGRNKKLKFGRKSDQWVFADSAPTSERELVVDNLENGVDAIPTAIRSMDQAMPPAENLEFDPTRLNETIGYLPSLGETKISVEIEQVNSTNVNQELDNNPKASDDLEKPSSLDEGSYPTDTVVDLNMNLDNIGSPHEQTFYQETASKVSEITTERKPQTIGQPASGDTFQVEQSSSDPIEKPELARERQSTPTSLLQENLDSLNSETLRPEAKGLDHDTATSDQETEQPAFEANSYSPNILEESSVISNSDPATSSPKLPIASEAETKPDAELNSLSDSTIDSNENISFISPHESPNSVPIDVSSEAEQDDFYLDTESESLYTVSDQSSEEMIDPNMLTDTDEFSESESEDAASDNSVEETPYPDIVENIEQSSNGQPLLDRPSPMTRCSIVDRRNSIDDEMQEKSEDSLLVLDNSSFKRSVSVPLDTSYSKTEVSLLAKDEGGSFLQSENCLIESTEKSREAIGARSELEISRQLNSIFHHITNAVENKISLEVQARDSSKLITKDLKITTPLPVAQSDDESNRITDETLDDNLSQTGSNLHGATVDKDAKYEKDQFQSLVARRKIDEQNDVEVETEQLHSQTDSHAGHDQKLVHIQTTYQRVESSKDHEVGSIGESQISEDQPFNQKPSMIPSEDESENLNQQIGDKVKRSPSGRKPAVEIISLDSEDEHDIFTSPEVENDSVRILNELASANHNHFKDLASPSKIVKKPLLRSASPDTSKEVPDRISPDLEDLNSKAVSDQNQLETRLQPRTIPEMLPLSSDQYVADDSNPSNESLSRTQLLDSQLQNADAGSQTSAPSLEMKVLDDSEIDPRLRKQLLTPKLSQQPSVLSEQSALSHLNQDDQDLPTPALTQSTSAPLPPPRTPDQPRKLTLIEKLKAMRNASAEAAKFRTSSNKLNAVSPWFTPKEISQVTHVSDSEGDAEGQSTDDDLIMTEGGQKQDEANTIFSTPSTQQSMVEEKFSPIHLTKTIEKPPVGFRTSHSYFAPLTTLSSHFNTEIDILATVLATTPITRAKSGPRDYNQTISITDPSLVSSPIPIIIAQIFRPHRTVFPSITQGDSILLRNFKVQSFQNRLGLLSTDDSAWAVFRKDAEVQIKGPPVEFGAEERGFARGLWGWWGSLGTAKRNEFEKALEQRKTVKAEIKDASNEEDKAEQMDTEVDTEVTPKKSVRRSGRGRPRGRPSRGEGILRHELRDGASYTDSRIEGKGAVHELRDGTTYSDSVER